MIDLNSKEVKWELARSLLCREVPYLSAAVWALRGPFWRKGINTAGVSKDFRVYIDPDFIQQIDKRTLAAVIEHEVWHVLLEHCTRCADRERQRWNVVADAEIHTAHLRDASLTALNDACAAVTRSKLGSDDGGIITPSVLGLPDGRTAEFYYDNVRVCEVCTYQSGSGVDGSPRDYETPQPGDPKTEGASTAERRAITRDVAQAVQKSKNRGDTPGGVERWAEEILGSPSVDWRVLYRQALHTAVGRRAGAVDYTYSKPSRRDAGARRGYVAPGLYRPVPEVAVILDTSGSMSERELGLAMREIVGIARSVGARIQVASCDADIYGWTHYSASMQLSGGGGTDMALGVAAAAALKPTPHVIVVMTDGETPWPDESVKRSAVVAVLTSPYSADNVPDWITTIVLPESGENDEEW
jgi:predicted metal-dependent peptidase